MMIQMANAGLAPVVWAGLGSHSVVFMLWESQPQALRVCSIPSLFPTFSFLCLLGVFCPGTPDISQVIPIIGSIRLDLATPLGSFFCIASLWPVSGGMRNIERNGHHHEHTHLPSNISDAPGGFPPRLPSSTPKPQTLAFLSVAVCSDVRLNTCTSFESFESIFQTLSHDFPSPYAPKIPADAQSGESVIPTTVQYSTVCPNFETIFSKMCPVFKA